MLMKDEIARVAHDFYLMSGRKNGHDLDHWLAAEELVSKWFEPFEEREMHVGAVIPDEHKVDPTHDTVES